MLQPGQFVMPLGFATSHPFFVVCIGFLLKPGYSLRYCLLRSKQFTALLLNIISKYLCDLLTFKSSLYNLRSSGSIYFLCELFDRRRQAIELLWQKRQRSCLRTDVSYLLCCTRKRDICVTQSLIVFKRKGKPLYREKTVYIKIFTYVHLLYTQIHLIFTYIHLIYNVYTP